MKLRFKPGTEVKLFDPDLFQGLRWLVKEIGTVMGVDEVTITSVNDGVHKTGSLHYEGKAVDIRSKIYPPEKVALVVAAFKRVFDQDYDLIWESQGKPSEHLHLEYDPGNRSH